MPVLKIGVLPVGDVADLLFEDCGIRFIFNGNITIHLHRRQFAGWTELLA